MGRILFAGRTPWRGLAPAIAKAGPSRPWLGIPYTAVGGYIGFMRRSPHSRVIGLLLATLVGLSAPGLGLAHGYAHHEANEHTGHEREHHHGLSERAPAAPDELIASVRGTESSGDHGHPELSLALSSRTDLAPFVLAVKVELLAYMVVRSQASMLLTAAPPRAGPPDAPPRQPRAPPLG